MKSGKKPPKSMLKTTLKSSQTEPKTAPSTKTKPKKQTIRNLTHTKKFFTAQRDRALSNKHTESVALKYVY